MRGADNIGKHELIGLDIKILESPDQSLVGLEGKIVDESKNMLVIDVDGKEKNIAKKVIKFAIQENMSVIDGAKITYRPEDRIKKVRSW